MTSLFRTLLAFKSGGTSGSWFDNATTWLQGRVHALISNVHGDT